MNDAGHRTAGKLDSRAVRELFPHLEEFTYLNTAAAGLSWKGQGAAAARGYCDHKSRGFSARLEWRAELERTRGLLSGLLQVTPQETSFAFSTTERLKMFAHSVQLEPGDGIWVL